MAAPKAGKTPAPPKKTSTKQNKPAAPAKKRAGIVASKRAPAAKKAPAVKKVAPRKQATKRTPEPVIVNPQGLNGRQSRFVEEYMVDLNATQAAIRAGYSPDTASEQACRLLGNVKVQQAVAAERIKQQERTQISADRVVLEAWHQVTADARELTSLVYHACRHCHGIGHNFHWRDEEEFAQAVDKAVSDNALREPTEPPIPIPVNLGGFGYSRRLEPDPACPKCDGDGLMDVRIGDTRKLSPAALSLFAGIKQTKFGIEVLTHSKDAAMEKLFKHLGLYEQDNRQKTDALTSLLATITQGGGNGFKPVSEDPEHKEG